MRGKVGRRARPLVGAATGRGYDRVDWAQPMSPGFSAESAALRADDCATPSFVLATMVKFLKSFRVPLFPAFRPYVELFARSYFFGPQVLSTMCAAASPLTAMSLKTDAPSLTEPCRTQPPSAIFVQALHGICSMSSGQWSSR